MSSTKAHQSLPGEPKNGQICTGACVQVTKNCVAGAQTGPEATRGGSLRSGWEDKNVKHNKVGVGSHD